MVAPDELLSILERILPLTESDSSVLEGWSKTEDGQKVVQFVIQIGKYNTNFGQGEDISIGDGLDKKLLEEIRDLLRSQQSHPLPKIDWQQVSRSLLDEQIQRLTTNPLTHAEGITYRTEQVYVPLGLVERKRPSRRREDVSPEQGSLLYEETEITQKFEHEAFLEQVLRQGHSPRSDGRRIAIIGEPGAGKTTLLQQIARWVAENIEGAIAIWVSLADLQGQELEDYLLKRWLSAVVQQIGQAEASTQVKDAFVAQVQQGRVWLLLDGVDEMQVASGSPLSEIERQVRLGGLLSQARMVLTCRLNLWDGNRHALDAFDTYRTLEFSYPVQVEQFVGQWFEALPDVQAGQAERLCAALKQPGKERIRDLVKNPLRLTLLCFNWYLGEGTLPETKAELYEQFVADFYEWKRDQFPTTTEQRRQLNVALGELGREAIDKEETRFRLRHDFVCKFLGEPDELDSLFQLALQLGWLNQVGVDAENRRKVVYVFFHPSFQEYFAALRIVTSFNSDVLDQGLENLVFHIYEEQWWEIFLLVAEMLDNADALLESINFKLNNLLAVNSAKLQSLFTRINQKALLTKFSCYTEEIKTFQNLSYERIRALIRAFYCANTLNNPLNLNRSSDSVSDQASALVNALNPDFSLDQVFATAIGLGIESTLDHDIVTERALTGILALALDLNQKLSLDSDFTHARILVRVLDSCFQDFLNNKILFFNLNLELKQALKTIKHELPSQINVDIKEWWKLHGFVWTEKLRNILIEHKGIGYNWEFNAEELELLKLYLKGSRLLVECLDSTCCITSSIKQQIEGNLLLPMNNAVKEKNKP